MAQLVINVGSAPNDGLGDPIRTAYQKCNTNFSELYSRTQTAPPPTLAGSVGDTAGMYAYDDTYFYYCFADYDGSTIIWGQITNVTLVNTWAGIQDKTNASGPTEIALGYLAGNSQGSGSIAFGSNAGATGQSASAIAIGSGAGRISQGLNSIAIGAGAGNSSQANNSIILNATGSNLTSSTANTFTVSPVRNDTGNVAEILFYNTTTKEISYGNLINISGNVSGSNLSTGGSTYAVGNVTGGNINTSGAVSATGNIIGNNVSSTTTMQLAVYANTTVRDSSISSPVPGMMIYVTGTGMQVRGETSWNTVTGTGT